MIIRMNNKRLNRLKRAEKIISLQRFMEHPQQRDNQQYNTEMYPTTINQQ